MKTKRTELEKVVPTTSREMTLFDEMDRLFDTLMHRGWLRPFREMWPEWPFGGEEMGFRAPRVDLIDREEELLVRAELPGVDKKDLDINLTGSTLTLHAETRKEEKKTEGEYFRAEIAHGAFSRMLHLPEEILPEAVKATFENGVLEVHLPKAHKVERRKIEVT